MSARRMVLALAAALALSGCGGSESDAPDPVAAESSAAVASAGAAATTPATTPATAEKPKKGATTSASVAPEVVVPSTSDTRTQTSIESWKVLTIEGLKEIDPRLVTNEDVTIKRVLSLCRSFSNGMFATKAEALIQAKFKSVPLTDDQAGTIYGVLLQRACYVMSES